MSTSSHDQNEVRMLTDLVFDGSGGHDSVRRLELLITNDLACMQAYVEQINFHGVVSQMAKRQSPERAALSVLDEFTKAIRYRDLREKRRKLIGLLGAVSLAFAISAFFLAPTLLQRRPVATVANLTSNVVTDANLETLGRIVRNGDTIHVKDGLMTLEMTGVIVDVMSPSLFTMKGSDKIFLKSGRVIVKVPAGKTGFTVCTPMTDVVDFGTEFLVSHTPETGTKISVRQGRVQASLLDRRGEVTQKIDLTDHRTVTFAPDVHAGREVDYLADDFSPIDESRGGIATIDGMLRTAVYSPRLLLAGELLTKNHILIAPEQQKITLQKKLVVNTLNGPLRIPAGSIVSSYLVHYDPPGDLSQVPRGSVTFTEPIAGVVFDSEQLAATDALFAAPGRTFDPGDYRGLEIAPDEDRVQISQDRRTVSFHFDMSPPAHLDEARIIIVHSP